jgi:hypothetical protein
VPNYIKSLLLCIVVIVLFYPAFSFHYGVAVNGYIFGYDAMQYIPPFDLYDTKAIVPGTYIKDYYFNALMFPGYKLLYKFAAQYWDAHEASRYIPYILYVFTIGLITYIAGRIGGRITATCVLVLLLSTSFIFKWGYLGGTSRMFAYTFFALTLWAVQSQRPYILAFQTVLASLFYPLVAAISGLTLALWLLVIPHKYQGQSVSDWSMVKRLSLLTIAGLLTIFLVLPTMLAGEAYGPRVTSEDVSNHPEAGAEGRYIVYGDSIPYPVITIQPISYFVQSLIGTGSAPIPFISLRENSSELSVTIAAFLLWMMGMAIFIILVGYKYLVKSDSNNLRILLPFFASIILFVLAHVFSPRLYIPGRFLVYSIPLLATFLFPLALYGLSQKHPNRHAHAIIWVPILIIFVLGGGRGDGLTPWHLVIPETDKALYENIAALPRGVIIAGWPNKKDELNNPMDNIPYLSQRNVLFNHETHQALHMKYMQELRRRMDALISAYFATDIKPLKYLEEEYGVTHLLININHYSDTIPGYFMPWGEQIETVWRASKNKAILADPEIQQHSAVFTHEEYILLDLGKVVKAFRPSLL